ncbi:MvaI/BcnI family restriction endonuclease [Asticcacaulis sp. SL142]|uniref:MvaI/BcnI family restriction endonuclease n=1 Tax=Asticcacaulis sp. SL142 TaxID=2995155 RepID=UPI00226C93D1|nr:MvaI/BcnI family restriction endonuclease [Asticcacaulis sp. SL142]WAC49802.1 MvaI/BcnI family restriction endonuclease [Asticcacaulis sp. SL142]
MVDSLSQLLSLMLHHGATRIYAKKLSPNDNSKNQVYLGGDFSVLNIIPHNDIYTDSEEAAGSVRDRGKASLNFFWVDQDGKHPAPEAQLILYPKYPEVRMSGLLKRCKQAPSEIMRVRDPGRVLFIGVTARREVLGFAVKADSPVAVELNSRQWESLGVFLELPASADVTQNPKSILLAELRRIHALKWIASQKLSRDGRKLPYAARNAGGYTLEAELGISPNGYSEPDFMGWEIKQYSVTDFQTYRAKTPVTLMTPEPNGGTYKDEGVAEFLRRFGYADKSGKADRFNFGGIYTCDKDFHADTGLKMTLDGYDVQTGKITDMEGSINLMSRTDEMAASWSFKGIMQHWNRKHAQAAYLPCLFHEPPPEYAYGAKVLLCEQTDFILFIKALASGKIYYDPAVKIENASSLHPAIKRRSQFRIKHAQIVDVYHQNEEVLLS